MSSKVERVIERQKGLIAEGNFYESQQQVKTMANRSILKKNYEEGCSLYFEGGMLLLEADQYQMGYELAELYVDSYKNSGKPLDREFEDKVLNLYGLIPLEPACMELKFKLMKLTLKLKHSDELHEKIGHDYMRAGRYAEAHRHFIGIGDIEQMIASLKPWMAQGFDSERDLFYVRSTLQLLSIGKLESAKVFFNQFDEKIDSPLTNFCSFLLDALEVKELSLYNMLKNKYMTSLKRDESLLLHLDQVGKTFFNIQPASGKGGIFDAISGMLFSDDPNGEAQEEEKKTQ